MKSAKLVLAFTLMSASVVASALEIQPNDIVISATRIKKNIATLTQSVSVITAAQIKAQNFTNVVDILRQQPGIEVAKAGGPGEYGYIKMRGFSTGHILLVIDGVKINNEGATDGIGAILNQMSPSSIQKIEILRGPQAVLYGADSTAGVIAITTKTGQNSSPAFNINIEAGSLSWEKVHATLRNRVKLGSGMFNYSLQLSKTRSKGIIKEEYFKNNTAQITLGYNTDKFETGIQFWRTNNKFDYAQLLEPYDKRTTQTLYGFQLPDPNQYSASRHYLVTAFIKHNISPSFSQKLQISQTVDKHNLDDQPDGILGVIIAPENNFYQGGTTYNKGQAVLVKDTSTRVASTFDEKSRQLSYNLNYQNKAAHGLFGFEDYLSRADNNATYLSTPASMNLDYQSAYLNGDYSIANSGIIFAGGVRHDHYKNWKNKTTGSIGINYLFHQASLFANYGTSYKVPTLLQSTGNYGNTHLNPESGNTLSAGFKQQLMQGRLAWKTTLWQTRLNNVIFFDGTIPNSKSWNGLGKYNNGNVQHSKGVTLGVEFSLTPTLLASGNYTYTDSKMKAKNASVWTRTVQLARNTGNLGLFYDKDKVSASMNMFYSGPRLRWKGDVEMKSYVRTDVSARYHFTHRLTAYTRIENLFNQKIIALAGYKPLGTYVVAGINYKFL